MPPRSIFWLLALLAACPPPAQVVDPAELSIRRPGAAALVLPVNRKELPEGAAVRPLVAAQASQRRAAWAPPAIAGSGLATACSA